MNFTSVRRGLIVVVGFLITFGLTTSPSAQDLAVLRAESLNKVIEGVEAVAVATGQPVSREMIMGMASGTFGLDPSEVLDLDRPLVVVMPLAGMMMQQQGVVAAVPVTDATAVIDALAVQFPDHTVEGELHTFATEQGPVLFLMETEGYLRVGGDADLVAGTDPLAGEATGSALSLEIFLEAVAPMLEGGLDAAKEQMAMGLEAAAAADEDVQINPEAMAPILDFYIDGARYLLANTSSLRIGLDVDDGFVRFSKTLVPIPESSLAGFVAAQKGSMPEIAKVADSDSAWFMAGQLTFGDEHRDALKAFVDVYMDVMTSVLNSQGGASAATEADGGDEGASAEAAAFWNDYMAIVEPFTDRWIDCLRGDMVASFNFPAGGPLEFTEAFGLNPGESCAQLGEEMGDELAKAIAASDELSEVFTMAKGPAIGGGETLVMTFDMMKMMNGMGQPMDEQARVAMKTLYGETMNAAMVTVGDTLFAAGGDDATGQLRGLAAALDAPGKAPSFAPLAVGPGMMMSIQLGEILMGIKDAVPEEAEAIESAAEALSGKAGRIPMAFTFDTIGATFEMAVSLETIETITTLAMEAKERAAEAEAEDMYSDDPEG
jgi:hypothetical protein